MQFISIIICFVHSLFLSFSVAGFNNLSLRGRKARKLAFGEANLNKVLTTSAV